MTQTVAILRTYDEWPFVWLNGTHLVINECGAIKRLFKFARLAEIFAFLRFLPR